MARYSLFVLKVSLNTNKPTKPSDETFEYCCRQYSKVSSLTTAASADHQRVRQPLNDVSYKRD